MRIRPVAVLLLALVGSIGHAQELYDISVRPRSTRYDVLATPHFEVIFQRGLAGSAREAAVILEAALPETRALVGLKRHLRMPVVLNGYNDLANGYVSPVMFRQEVEGVALKGSAIDPGFDSWMEAVLPHELTHAVHAEIRPRFGFGGLMALVSPDVSRALNFTIPIGLTEGIAVYREGQVRAGVGRLDHGYFESRYRAAMESRRPWSLAQHLEAAAYSQPLDRHYVGGAFAYRALQQRFGPEFFTRSVALYNRWPFFGYGFALWVATRTPPWRLGRLLREPFNTDLLPAAAGGLPEGARIVAAGKGENHYRPLWLNDDQLVAYVDGYSVRPGFYTIDVDSGARRPVAHHALSEDRFFSLSEDNETLFYARYHPDRVADTKWISEIHSLHLATGVSHRLTHGGRVFSPTPVGEEALWAVRNRDQFADWVRVDADGSISVVGGSPRLIVRQVLPKRGATTALLSVGVAGRSAVMEAIPTAGGRVEFRPLLASEQAGFYDLTWSPDGAYLLFTSDAGGTPDIFAFEIASGRAIRLTRSRYGAFEASVSPNGDRMAYSVYRHEARDLVVARFAPAEGDSVPDSLFGAARDLPWATLVSERPMPQVGGAMTAYRAWPRLLRPRLVLPVLGREAPVGQGDVDLGYASGLSIEGTDPLQRWAYGLQGFRQADRFWGEMAVRSGALSWKPSVRAYAMPSSQRILLQGAQPTAVDTVRVGKEEVGFELGGSLPLFVDYDVFQTSASVQMTSRLRRVRFFDRGKGFLDPYPSARAYTTRATLNPTFRWAYRLQANRRDLMPNTGWLLTSTADVDLYAHRDNPQGTDVEASRAWLTTLGRYFSVWPARNQTLRVRLGALVQNRGSIYDLDTFLPRGYENDVYLAAGTFWRADLQLVSPLWYVDNGFVVVPAFVDVLYIFAFGESVASRSFDAHWTSVGLGLGALIRIANARIPLRIGVAWQLEERRFAPVYR